MGILTRDIVIIGGGIIGLALARELKRRDPHLTLTVFEKEASLGAHASGRNSGVLHSGIYYPPHTLKAQVCREGAAALRQYCQEQELPLEDTGKIIVPTCPEEGEQLKLLYERGIENGVAVSWLDAAQLRALEPEARSATGQALWIPETATFDPKTILHQLSQDLQAQGVEILLEHPVQQLDPRHRQVLAKDQVYHYGYLFNTAGLQADRVAQAFGIGQQYTMLPFKGLYYELKTSCPLQLQHHLYPVPDLRVPFLGVHFTKSLGGKVYVGPTAIPALGRENYQGFQDLHLPEMVKMARYLFRLYLQNQQGFRYFTHQEACRFLKPYFLKAVQALVPAVQAEDLIPSSKVGIRAQLLDRRTHTLVMDFLVEQAENSTHILNAVSPAFTSAFTFANFVLDHYFGWKPEGQIAYAAQQ